MTSLNVDSEDPEANDVQVKSNVQKDDEDSIGHLREEALRRKERLRQLRMKKLKQSKDESTLNGVEDDLELPKPIFRNYKPQSDELKDGELPVGKPVDLTHHITAQLEAANAPVIVEEVNLMNLAPRKPDWDLKRGVEKKLRKLERRTQRAIAELIRERLKQNQQEATDTWTEIPISN